MILSILVSEKDRRELIRTAFAALSVSAFCFVFYLIYNIFSHGVHSPFMTFMFAWPLFLVGVPAGLLYWIDALPGPSLLASLFWNTGTAAATVSSLLRGIFEIAGNSSIYQHMLMIAGFIMLGIGALLYFAGILLRSRAFFV